MLTGAARRSAAAAALALACLCIGVGGAGVAHAAEPDQCLVGVVPQMPDQGIGGIIDAKPSGYGYGGMQLDSMKPRLCLAGKVVMGPGQTRAEGYAELLSEGLNAVQAIAKVLARIAFDPTLIWQIVSTILMPVNSLISPAVVVMFIAIMTCFTATWLTWRDAIKASLADYALTRRQMITAGLIACTAVITMAWSSLLPPLQSQTIATSLAAVQVATSGETSTVDEAIDDAFTNYIRKPAWEYAMFGNDKATAQAYGERLRAARGFSVDEVAEYERLRNTDGNAANKYIAELTVRKVNDQKQVVGEIRSANPAAYERVIGEQSSGRIAFYVIACALAFLTGLVLVGALLVVVVAKFLLPFLTQIFPIVAALLQVPRWQWIVGEMVRELIVWTLAACAAVFVFVVWMLGPVNNVLANPNLSLQERASAVALLYVALALAWTFRGRIRARYQRVAEHARQRGERVATETHTVSIVRRIGEEFRAARSRSADNIGRPAPGPATEPPAPTETPRRSEDASFIDRVRDARERRLERLTRERAERATTEDAATADTGDDTGTAPPTDTPRPTRDKTEFEKHYARRLRKLLNMEEDELNKRAAQNRSGDQEKETAR